MSELHQTPLFECHKALGAKMVPFAGYEMPVQFPLGVMKEHLHTRAKAGLFDVSHMGQVILRGRDYAAAALGLERLIPMDVLDLQEGRQRYGFFTNAIGGIEDDLMFANRGDHLFLVVNAACKDKDIAYLQEMLPDLEVTEITDRVLLALQGPSAAGVLSTMNPAIAQMRFMDVATLELNGVTCWVSRSGYTGEDGFEISLPASAATDFALTLLAHPEVAPIGLGARDSLRLEAGLCLYGHDIDHETSPVEAGLTWAIQKSRRSGGTQAGGFPGDAQIARQLAEGASRARVGLCPKGRAPMREGVMLFATEESAEPIGRITSGGFGPTVGGPVAMGYVASGYSSQGTTIYGELRGNRLPLVVTQLPFTPPNFKR